MRKASRLKPLQENGEECPEACSVNQVHVDRHGNFLGMHRVSRGTIENVVKRLTRNAHEKTPDTKRTGAYQERGVWGSFSCNGW